MEPVQNDAKLRDEFNWPGLQEVANEAGLEIEEVDGVFHCRDAAAFDVLSVSYDPLPRAKKAKIAAIKREGFSRVRAVFPAIRDFDELELELQRWLSIAPAARSATATYQQMLDIVQAARSAIAQVNVATTLDEVRAVTVSWP